MRPQMAILLSMVLSGAATAGARDANSGGPEALVVLPGAQTDGPGPRTAPDFGTSGTSSVSYAAQAFQPIDSSVTWAFASLGGNLATYRTGGSSWFEAPVNLPTGSLIESVEFRFCDSNAAAQFDSFLTINDKNGAALAQPRMVFSTDPETPGCINRTFTPASPIPVDNGNKAYSLEVYLEATDNTVALGHGRINYRLQVSPDPPGATFADVPNGHPFHRFIEALAAAGITGGCGGGNYCPNQAVTRGQMAVFLSVALGLHFPN